MTISAKIVEDSISPSKNRLTTMQLCYPRWIHAEFLTHRVFSRNASSSRAIPVAKMLEMVRSDPASPIHWGKNQPGMQAACELDMHPKRYVQSLWLQAAQAAAGFAERMEAEGAHKQIVNRILEPFQHIQVIVTATEWENFFALRAHKDAQPEIQALAVMMREAMNERNPTALKRDEWHLPYVTTSERNDALLVKDNLLVKLSAARCARVSYLTHDGAIPKIAADLTLYERLVGSAPIHASPIEHQATPDHFDSIDDEWKCPHLHGNLRGWIQYRKTVEQQFKG